MAFWSRKATDPVCGMKVKKKEAAATLAHMGKTYYFCAPGCKAEFARDPQKHLGGSPAPMSHNNHP